MISGILAAIALAQATAAPVDQATAQPATVVVPAAPVAAAAVILPRDTPIELMAVTEVSTANATPGKLFRLRVNRPVGIDGRVVIPVGAMAFGEVLTARESEILGKSGKLTAHLLYLKLGDAEIPLEGDVAAKGRGAASGVGAVLGAGLMGLFSRGNNAKIKAGEIVVGFVSGDAALDLSGTTARLAAVPPTPAAIAPQPAALPAK